MNELIAWSLCAACGQPVGHDDAHPVLACGRRCHSVCMPVHLEECKVCRDLPSKIKEMMEVKDDGTDQ